MDMIWCAKSWLSAADVAINPTFSQAVLKDGLHIVSHREHCEGYANQLARCLVCQGWGWEISLAGLLRAYWFYTAYSQRILVQEQI